MNLPEIEALLLEQLQALRDKKTSSDDFTNGAIETGYVDHLRAIFVSLFDPQIVPDSPSRSSTSVRSLIQNVLKYADDPEVITLPRHYKPWPDNVDVGDLDKEAMLRYEDDNAVDKSLVPYLSHAITDQEVAALSPFDGSRLTSRRGLLVYTSGRPHIFYFFAGREPFFLIINPFAGCKSGYYFPYRNIVIGQMPINYANQIAALKAFCVASPVLTHDYIHGKEKAEPILTLSFMSHLGHTLFNEINGIDQIVENDLVSPDCSILVGPHEFIPMTEFFPEFMALETATVKNGFAAFEFILRNRRFPVRPTVGHYWVTQAYRERARRFVDKRPPFERSQELVGRRPVIWIEIRSNDRVWINQIDAVADVARRLKVVRPNAVLFLAGWSRPLQPTAKDDREIRNDLKVVRAIQERVGDDLPVFSGVNLPTAEKLQWAFVADAYISTLGSGMLMPGYLANNPGVVHSNTGYAGSPVMNPDLDQRQVWAEALTPYQVVEPIHVEDDPDTSNVQIRGHRVDGEIVFERLMRILGAPES